MWCPLGWCPFIINKKKIGKLILTKIQPISIKYSYSEHVYFRVTDQLKELFYNN